MILCPLKSKIVRKLGRFHCVLNPKFTQYFGENPKHYEQYNMIAHNGFDYSAALNTPLYAPFTGKVKIKKNYRGYGFHVRIRSWGRALECVIAHMSSFAVKDGDIINEGDLIGYSGNTGDSSGPHVHQDLRRLLPDNNIQDIFKWKVKDYDNGYFGAFDFYKKDDPSKQWIIFHY